MSGTTRDGSSDLPAGAVAAVSLQVPLGPAGVRVARAAITSEAAAAGLTVDRIDDARQIVAELAALWPTASEGTGSTLHLDISTAPGQLGVDASVTPPAEPDLSSFAWTLIEELGERSEVRVAGGATSVAAVIGTSVST